MLRGEHPKHEISKIFDISLILHAEHSFNASTFAAREIASTRASIYASIGGAVGALSGELHGGANIQVMKMLLEIGECERMWKNGSRIGSQKVQESWGWAMQYIEQLTQGQRSLQHYLGLFPKKKIQNGMI